MPGLAGFEAVGQYVGLSPFQVPEQLTWPQIWATCARLNERVKEHKANKRSTGDTSRRTHQSSVGEFNRMMGFKKTKAK